MAAPDAAPIATEAERRWEDGLAELSHRARTAEGSMLALVVGSSDEVRRGFVQDLSARLAPRLELREIPITPERPNPLIEVMDEAGVESRVYLLHGLGDLPDDERKQSLHLLNWSRSQLVRRLVKVVLWVEPALVRELYQEAGDFADWWSALVELPEVAPSRLSPMVIVRSRWELLTRLHLLHERQAEVRRKEKKPSEALEQEIREMSEALVIKPLPGMIVAGARLIGAYDDWAWTGRDLKSGAPRLVYVLDTPERQPAFVRALDLLRLIAGLDHPLVKYIPGLCAVDEEVLGYSVELPRGKPASELLRGPSWSVRERAEALLRACELVEQLELLNLVLGALRPEQMVVDERSSVRFVCLGALWPSSALGTAPERTKIRRDVPQWVRLKGTPDSWHAWLLRNLLLVLVSGAADAGRATLGPLKSSKDGLTRDLAGLAMRIVDDEAPVWSEPGDPEPAGVLRETASLRRAVQRALKANPISGRTLVPTFSPPDDPSQGPSPLNRGAALSYATGIAAIFLLLGLLLGRYLAP